MVNQQKSVFNNTNTFKDKGGLAQMGKAMDNGMVLVMSLWADCKAENCQFCDGDSGDGGGGGGGGGGEGGGGDVTHGGR